MLIADVFVLEVVAQLLTPATHNLVVILVTEQLISDSLPLPRAYIQTAPITILTHTPAP